MDLTHASQRNKKNKKKGLPLLFFFISMHKVHVSTRHHGGLEVDSFLWVLCTVRSAQCTGSFPFGIWGDLKNIVCACLRLWPLWGGVHLRTSAACILRQLLRSSFRPCRKAGFSGSATVGPLYICTIYNRIFT